MPTIVDHNAFGQMNLEALTLTPFGVVQLHSWKKALGVAIQDHVLSLKELGSLERKDIAVFMPDGFATSELTFVDVVVLFDAPHRTRALRQQLSEALRAAVHMTYAAVTPARTTFEIEVAVRAFDRERDIFLP
jgi:hypothetical protein